MEHSFWHSKWHNNEIGFHEPTGNALLVKYSDVLLGSDSNEASQKRIFVPLCGKTRDIAWLLSKGCQVVGAELSEVAITQLFDDLDITPTVKSSSKGKVYSAPNLTIFVGDIFALRRDDIGEVKGVYDRAALVALPDELRRKYANHLIEITHNAPQLVITFDYDQSKLPGPPFCVDEKRVIDMYAGHYEISLLERSDVEGGLKKKVKADNLVFSLSI
ncbi:thiopurine S-methyltransferase [Alteromonas sp. BMJM2]|uniref:thiopurine S-methyltransferase n=1 Tax=Alteromonas sp. BMJM2 TaxID=2954241 RepID=UPI0022B3F82C|nr:thiopurine S-methyltransferase [Alteromonas sp. BMJM2]